MADERGFAVAHSAWFSQLQSKDNMLNKIKYWINVWSSPEGLTATDARVAKSANVDHAKSIDMARSLIVHSVSGILNECGNSYANSYTEKWLRSAKSLGAYHGRVTGKIHELQDEWEEWLNANDGYPELPDIHSENTLLD